MTIFGEGNLPFFLSMQDPDPFDMLFRAKWNVPKAADALGFPPCEQSWEWVKDAFRDRCLFGVPQNEEIYNKNMRN